MNEIAGNKYSLDVTEEEIINIYIKEWVLQWCEKYHPEAFEKARQFVKENLNENV